MSKKQRIFWTTAERAQVAEAAVKILRAYPRMPYFRAVGEAQTQVLPPERQRWMMSAAALGELGSDIERLLNRPVEHAVETGRYVTAEAPIVSDDAIKAAARAVAERFEVELRAAMLETTSRVAAQAAEGKL